ncbi:MAG: TerB family tellurite resistance protein, partial [Rhizobiaceae bacterium]
FPCHIIGGKPLQLRSSPKQRYDPPTLRVVGLAVGMGDDHGCRDRRFHEWLEADDTERRRIISLFRAAPQLQGFSADDVAREIDAHAQAFELDHSSALSRARAQIVTSDLSNEQFRAIMGICVLVLEADGVRHPEEERALVDISAMRPWGYR